MPVQYRGATPDDFAQLLPLLEAFARERAAGTGHRLKDDFMDTVAEMLRQHLLHPAAFVVVAEENGELIGYASGMTQEPPPLFHDRPFLFVSDLYVIPARRNQGIGTGLLERLQGFAFLRGIPRISLVVPAADPAVKRCMEKLGFGLFEALYLWQG